MTIPKAVAIFDVVACPATPVAHLAIVLAPCMDSPIADSDLGLTTSLALEIGGLVHVTVDATTDASYRVSSGETVQTPVHGQTFVLKGFLQGPDTMGDLASFRVVGVEVLNFAL